MSHFKITTENAEFTEKISFADCYLEKKRGDRDYLRNAIEEVDLHSISSALSVNSAVNLTMSS